MAIWNTPPMHTAEKARQNSVRHAHRTQKVHISRIANVTMQKRAIPWLGRSVYRPAASRVANSGESRRAGSFFSTCRPRIPMITNK